MADAHFRAGFLQRFPRRALRQRLAELHEPRRNRPVTTAGLDGAFAEQDPAISLGHTADHDQRILVMNVIAGVADPAILGVPRGGFAADGRAAAGAILHW